MAGLASNPEFQKAMLRKRAEAIGGMQNYNTEDITRHFGAQMMGRDMQLQNIENQKRRSLKSIDQRGRLLGMDKKRVKRAERQLSDEMSALPLTLGIGMGTSLISGLEGRRRSNLLEQDRQEQIKLRKAIESGMVGIPPWVMSIRGRK